MLLHKHCQVQATWKVYPPLSLSEEKGGGLSVPLEVLQGAPGPLPPLLLIQVQGSKGCTINSLSTPAP